MKLRLNIADDSYTLDLATTAPGDHRYVIGGSANITGAMSVLEVMPGVYSILEGTRARLITLAKGASGMEAWIENERYLLAVSDPRDSASQSGAAGASGPLELRSLMPGKVIRVLVEVGANVSAGEGLVVVEAMKMQNELKAPRDGRVTAVTAVEGATVAGGATLIVLE